MHPELCPNCGAVLDVWGICSRITPEDAAKGLKTCETRHPDNCACDPCEKRRQATNAILDLSA